MSEMIEAARWEDGEYTARNVWREMIDAALAEARHDPRRPSETGADTGNTRERAMFLTILSRGFQIMAAAIAEALQGSLLLKEKNDVAA